MIIFLHTSIRIVFLAPFSLRLFFYSSALDDTCRRFRQEIRSPPELLWWILLENNWCLCCCGGQLRRCKIIVDCDNEYDDDVATVPVVVAFRSFLNVFLFISFNLFSGCCFRIRSVLIRDNESDTDCDSLNHFYLGTASNQVRSLSSLVVIFTLRIHFCVAAIILIVIVIITGPITISIFLCQVYDTPGVGRFRERYCISGMCTQ